MQELINKNQEINIFDYIGLDIDKIPLFLKKNNINEYDFQNTKKQKEYKIYKYVDVNNIDIFIKLEQENELINISELFNNENLKKSLIDLSNSIDMDKVKRIEIDQDKVDISYPYGISFSTDKEWNIFYSKKQKKYYMVVSKENKNLESMFILLKKKIVSNKENATIKIYIPIVNEDYSDQFLTELQVNDLQNKLWFITNDRPKVYQMIDIYGNTSMQIIGEEKISNNLHTLYKFKINNKKESKLTFEFIDRIFTLYSNLKDFCDINLKIDENGIFQIYIDGEQILINNIDQFVNNQSNKKNKEIENLKIKNYELQIRIRENKEVLENKNQEFNQKQKQIFTFLQCKKTFFGRFKYFLKSNRKNRKVSRIDKLPKIEIEVKKEDNFKSYTKKQNYKTDDLFAIYNILNENKKILEESSEENNTLIDKIDIINQKIKNADLFIKEIENHKKSIFEFWKFTNKDLPNEIMEGKTNNKLENLKQNEQKIEDIDYNKLKYDISKIEETNLSKNEQDAIFVMKYYIDIMDYLESTENDDILQNILDNEKNEFEKLDSMKNIFYCDGNKTISLYKSSDTNTILTKKFNILNLNSKTTLEEFKIRLIQYKKILEKAYSKIKVPYNISIYSTINNNVRTEWCIANLELEPEISKGRQKNIDIFKYNVPQNSNIIIGAEELKHLGLKENEVLINIKNYDIRLKQKYKERVCVLDNNYNGIIKDVRIYEYDLL